MIGRMRNEMKLMGRNFFLVSSAVTFAAVGIAAAGELLVFDPLCYEVLFPFFTAVVVGEWGKTRADRNFDIIASQSRCLFRWVLLRYITGFALAGGFAVLCMAGASIVRYELPLWELLAIYVPPAFFLSSLCALAGIKCRQEHTATLICGSVWLIFLLIRSLLRVPGVEYIYLFIRYAGDQNGIWLWNKAVITAAALLLWGIIYWLCKDFST